MPHVVISKEVNRVEITLTVPDEMAKQIRPLESHLPQILELGIREWTARQEASFAGLAGVLEPLASLPPPAAVLAPGRCCSNRGAGFHGPGCRWFDVDVQKWFHRCQVAATAQAV